MEESQLSSPITRRTALKSLAFGTAGVAGALLSGDFLAACSTIGGGTSNAVVKTPIKVGALTDLTGAFGIVGKAQQALAQFTVDEINASGGILGRHVDLTVVDGASDPATAAKVATQLVTENKVDMVIGGITSAERAAVRTIITDRGRTIYIWPASYEGGECSPNVWSVGPVPNQQVDPIVDYLSGQGAKTYYLCGNDYRYPRGVLKEVRARIEARGGHVLGEDYIPLGATDAPELVTKILNLKPDAVFEIVILPATVPFIRGVIDGGYKGLIAGTLFDQSINPLLGKYAQGLISAQEWFPAISDSFSQQEVARFTAKYPDAVFSAVFDSSTWYRGLYLWKAAVERAGSTELAKVNKAMDSASSGKLIGGPARMKPGTRHCEVSMYLGQMQADGSVKVLKELGELAPAGQCA
jgi:ABC-type branched-subunit amino acid transport system substrate-binding protein